MNETVWWLYRQLEGDWVYLSQVVGAQLLSAQETAVRCEDVNHNDKLMLVERTGQAGALKTGPPEVSTFIAKTEPTWEAC